MRFRILLGLLYTPNPFGAYRTPINYPFFRLQCLCFFVVKRSMNGVAPGTNSRMTNTVRMDAWAYLHEVTCFPWLSADTYVTFLTQERSGTTLKNSFIYLTIVELKPSFTRLVLALSWSLNWTTLKLNQYSTLLGRNVKFVSFVLP